MPHNNRSHKHITSFQSKLVTSVRLKFAAVICIFIWSPDACSNVSGAPFLRVRGYRNARVLRVPHAEDRPVPVHWLLPLSSAVSHRDLL